MPDTTLPGAKRERSLTIAGILDIVIGSLGLAVAGLGTLVIGVVLCVVAWSRASNPPTGGDLSAGAGFAVAGAILVLGGIVFASAIADAWLVATGIQLLRRSPHARLFALIHTCLMVVLGAMDVMIASHAGAWRWIALPLVLPLPIYAVAQLAAFFVVPSWKALTTGSAARSTR